LNKIFKYFFRGFTTRNKSFRKEKLILPVLDFGPAAAGLKSPS